MSAIHQLLLLLLCSKMLPFLFVVEEVQGCSMQACSEDEVFLSQPEPELRMPMPGMSKSWHLAEQLLGAQAMLGGD